MKVAIAKRGCNGCGLCTDICPTIFKMNKNIYAEVSSKEIPFDKEKDVLEAEINCPVSVIILN
ncbi:ferredoxin [Anaerocolumna cellulosilytica]|uniref:Ferredoxin n=1 Tax=Anaerocolumna cellulosilytica TaxID=433286 RepID=A0A6S6QYD0_9FIRM|nr:ferredoxin [Anaerocolumna cellulosilytica]MBB5194030.1 ferredoxin [Anaerocolumna cellulosilytica]BCJ94756.1 ferredoxin [Anaerocolumna cellulosilytica]